MIAKFLKESIDRHREDYREGAVATSTGELHEILK